MEWPQTSVESGMGVLHQGHISQGLILHSQTQTASGGMRVACNEIILTTNLNSPCIPLSAHTYARIHNFSRLKVTRMIIKTGFN